jgi:ribonuclease-3
VEKLLDYRFCDPALLQLALTHRSADNSNNERLEFLGDAVLGQIVTDYLYRRFPDADEGQLTRSRASVVNKSRLADVARAIGLGDHIVLGEGELKSGGWRRDSILANTLEALIGAIYLDGGLEASVRQVTIWFNATLDAVDPSASVKDAKTRLQEYLQARNLALPQYVPLTTSGPAHDQLFTIECRVDSCPVPVRASGKSRRAGEQRAAELMLAQLETDPYE